MAIKCDNCENNASYTTSDPGVNPVNYCPSCLPSWLYQRAEAGQFPLVDPSKDKTSKKAEPVEEVAEEK